MDSMPFEVFKLIGFYGKTTLCCRKKGSGIVLANQKHIDWQHPIKTKAVEDSIS